MSKAFKKAFLVLFFIIIIFPLYSAPGPIAVSLCSNSSISIKYYRDKDNSITLNPAKVTTVNPGDSIYYTVKVLNPETYNFLGFRIVDYVDGKRCDSVIVPDTGSILIPREFKDVSIEPIGEYKKRDIFLSDSMDGIELSGSWRVNDQYTSKESDQVSPLEKFVVSYSYDSSKYYLLSAEPEKSVFAESSGSVVYKPQNPSASSSIESSYSIELESYTHISFSMPGNVLRVIYPDATEGNGAYISDRLFKSGESFTVETSIDYKIQCEALKIEETLVLDDRRVFSVTIPEDNDNYSIEIRLDEIERKNVPVALSGNTDKSSLAISTERNNYTLSDLIKKDTVVISEGDILYIENKTESRNERMIVSIECIDPELSVYDYDLKRGEALSFAFEDIQAIDIKIESGFRYTSIKQKSNEIDVKFYKNGNVLADGEFLHEGDVIEVITQSPAHLILSGKNLPRGAEKSSFTISSSTTADDFRISTEERAGLYFNPADYVYEEGKVVFSLNGRDITSEVFIESGNTISYRASEVKDGYRFEDGDIVVKGKDITVGLLDSIKFRENILSEIRVEYPLFGGKVSALYNGNVIGDEAISLYSGERIDFIYYPAQGWAINTDKTKAPDQFIAEDGDLIINLSSAFVERAYHKSNVVITINQNLGKDFEVDLTEAGKGSVVFVETKSFFFKNSTYSKDIGKVDSTILPIAVSGNHLGENEALSVTAVLYNESGDVLGKYTKLFTGEKESYDFTLFEEGTSKIEFIFEKINAEPFRKPSFENGDVKLYVDDREVREGEVIAWDRNVSYSIEVEDGYKLYLSNVNKGNSYKSYPLKYKNYLTSIDEILDEFKAKKLYSVELFYGEYEYDGEVYSYRLNNQLISDNIITFVEGDKLELSYTAPKGTRVNKPSLLNNRKTSGSIVLDESYNDSIIDKFSFGIFTIKEVR